MGITQSSIELAVAVANDYDLSVVDVDKISEAVVDRLFFDGSGNEARRLVLEVGEDIGGSGWCREAVVSQVRMALVENRLRVAE